MHACTHSDLPLAVALLVFLAELGSKLNCLKPTLQPVSLPAAASCLSDPLSPYFPGDSPSSHTLSLHMWTVAKTSLATPPLQVRWSFLKHCSNHVWSLLETSRSFPLPPQSRVVPQLSSLPIDHTLPIPPHLQLLPNTQHQLQAARCPYNSSNSPCAQSDCLFPSLLHITSAASQPWPSWHLELEVCPQHCAVQDGMRWTRYSGATGVLDTGGLQGRTEAGDRWDPG